MKEQDFPKIFPNPRNKMGYLFWQITMLWTRKVNQSLTGIDLTHTQMVTLAATTWLNSELEEVNQKDLVEAIKIDRMMISKLVSKLQEMDLIERTPSKKDSRAMALKPTKKGRTTIQNAFPVMMRADREFFGIMGDDEKKLLKLLQDLLDHAEEHMNIKNIKHSQNDNDY